MYSLKCNYWKAEFETLEELIEAAMINGQDPFYEILLNGQSIGEYLSDYIDSES
jgi:hypothetical protein